MHNLSDLFQDFRTEQMAVGINNPFEPIQVKEHERHGLRGRVRGAYPLIEKLV